MTDVTDGDEKPGPAAGGEAEPAPRKLLTRSKRLKVIGGVCGGLGRYFGIDPVIFRVVLVVLALTGGVGLISYGIGWLLIPMEGEDDTELRRLLSGRVEGTSMTAVFSTLVGSGLFLSTLDNGDTQAFSLSLIAAIVAAVYWSRRRRAALAAFGSVAAPAAEWAAGTAGGPGGGAAPVADAPPAAKPPPTDSPSWWRTQADGVSFEKAAGAQGAGGRAGYMWGPDSGDGGDGRDSSYAWPRKPGRRSAGRDGRGGALYGLLVFLLAAGVGSGAVAVGWRRHPLGSVLEVGFTAALGVLGLGLVIGSFLGRRGGGVIRWAVLATLLLAVSASMPKSVGYDFRATTWHPTTAARVQPLYTLGAGQGVLDLTDLPLHGGTVAARVQMGAGQIEVRVPRNVTVRVVAKVGLGDVRFPIAGRHNVSVSPKARSGTFPPAAGTGSAGTIKLTLQLGAGQVEVLRDPAT